MSVTGNKTSAAVLLYPNQKQALTLTNPIPLIAHHAALVCFSVIFSLSHPSQFEHARQFRQIRQAGFLTRQRSACARLPCRPDGSMRKRAWPWDAPSNQKPQHPLARLSCPEKLRGQARSCAKPRRICANASRQLEPVQCNPVYSPQRSTNSATVHALFSTPAACAGVMRIAP